MICYDKKNTVLRLRRKKPIRLQRKIWVENWPTMDMIILPIKPQVKKWVWNLKKYFREWNEPLTMVYSVNNLLPPTPSFSISFCFGSCKPFLLTVKVYGLVRLLRSVNIYIDFIGREKVRDSRGLPSRNITFRKKKHRKMSV